MDLIGFDVAQSKAFINHAFDTFDFTGKYIPNDLRSRGFPLQDLDKPKFKNYPYARNMKLMWEAIRQFVADMIDLKYAPDNAAAEQKIGRKFVSEDDHITAWYMEIQKKEGGRLSSFPTIRTRDQLTDAVTMCIHIASPQHTAVNYLQNFYQNFVIAKPPALYTPLPKTLESLRAFTELDLVKSLPIKHQRDYLLAVQIPWLLSFRVADENNLISYAASVWNVYKKKHEAQEQKIKNIATPLYDTLRLLIKRFEQHSSQMDEGAIPYIVMDPNSTAVSILI